MKTMNIHLGYFSLLIILCLTIFWHFPFSLYLFALIKSLIILYAFMNFRRAGKDSHIYFLLSLLTLGILFIFVYDDLHFR